VALFPNPTSRNAEKRWIVSGACRRRQHDTGALEAGGVALVRATARLRV
jgi:hypothetical protein